MMGTLRGVKHHEVQIIVTSIVGKDLGNLVGKGSYEKKKVMGRLNDV